MLSPAAAKAVGNLQALVVVTQVPDRCPMATADFRRSRIWMLAAVDRIMVRSVAARKP